MPRQNTLFGDIDYFKLVIFKKQKTQEKPLTFALIAQKSLGRGTASGKEPAIVDNYSLIRTAV